MQIHYGSLGRGGVLLVALLTLTFILVGPRLPVSQAENSTIEKAAPAQGTTNLQTSMQCTGNDLSLTIAGDGPFEIRGVGPGLPIATFSGSSLTLIGPGSWTLVTVYELSGDGEAFNLSDTACPVPPRPLPPYHLWAEPDCVGDDFSIDVWEGDLPMVLNGTGPSLPLTIDTLGRHMIPGPGAWRGLYMTELAGDYEQEGFISMECPPPPFRVSADPGCVGNDFYIDVMDGSLPMVLNGTGPELPLSIEALGHYTIPGPGAWTGLHITELAGDYENVGLVGMVCPTPPFLVTANQGCVGNDFYIDVMDGSLPMVLNGTGPGLPLSIEALGHYTIPGPGVWADLHLTELAGDYENVGLVGMRCLPPPVVDPIPFVAASGCTGDDFWVEITNGNYPFRLEGVGPGLPKTIAYYGVTTFAGPGTWTSVTLREITGDLEQITFPDVSCQAPPPLEPLQVMSTCSGYWGMVQVLSGDGPFLLTGSTINLPAQLDRYIPYSLGGPGTWSDLIVSEQGGDHEQISVPEFTCLINPASNVPPIPLPVYVPERVMEMPSTRQHIVYSRPGGDPIRNSDNSLLMLPHDSDGSGYDTFVVLDAQLYEGAIWLGIYLGSPDLGWLPQADLYPTTE